MSWIRDNALSWAQSLCVNAVKWGRVPAHVAFIMDGNRRFADKINVERGEGHSRGFDKLAETLQWCLDLGIPEVTVYAFSIENFKRSEDELNTLMSLAEDKFQRLIDERDLLMERGICVRVVGRLSLLSEKLRKLIADAMLITKDNTKAKLNVAFAYTGRDEITRAAADILTGLKKGLIEVEDISETLMSQTLELSSPDLLIRTSGEVRLSDFMIWQVSDTCLYFTDVLWPEFKIWNLLAAIIHYQRVHKKTESNQHPNESCADFLNDVSRSKWETLESYSTACR